MGTKLRALELTAAVACSWDNDADSILAAHELLTIAQSEQLSEVLSQLLGCVLSAALLCVKRCEECLACYCVSTAPAVQPDVSSYLCSQQPCIAICSLS
jgi:hypothetical protein